MSSETKLIFGCGYLGQRVAQQWLEAGMRVVVVTRSAENASAFDRQGYEPIVADVTRPQTLANLPAAETVLFSIGYDRESSRQSIAEVYVGGMRNVLAALLPNTGRCIYISTTGVYGDAGGGWVDEHTPPDPRREGGMASLTAEQLLAAHPLGVNSVVLRLAGIYGPGRVPFLKELRAGEPIPAPSSGHLNLIHVDDAATVVVAAASLPSFDQGPRVYCVSDGHPVERAAYYREVARQMAVPPPRFIDPDSDSPRALRARTDRRVRNDRMLAELPVRLAYPDHRAGLTAIFAAKIVGNEE